MTRVFTSSVLNAPIDAVWAKVRDFNGLPTYNPAVTKSEIEDGRPADAVGCVRAFYLEDGGFLREQLLELSDKHYSQTYNILESPMPVENYEATLRCVPITDGNRTYIEWSAEFDCPADEEANLIESIGQGVFQASFDKLAEML